MKRIHKIKTVQPVKETISDELIERLRDACLCKRDLAIVDLLYSTGIRVGELVRLNIDDISFEERECVVFGKGDKERRVYFDAKAKLHLQDYLKERDDDNPALFVTLDAPHQRLKISGVEIRIRSLGRSINAEKFILINSEELWQQEQLIKVCRLNRFRRFLDILRLIQPCSMQW